MTSPSAIRHTAVGAIAFGAVLTNLVFRVDWRLALLAGGAVVIFGELSQRFLPGRRLPRSRPPSAYYPLSRREVEVAILVSTGMSNKAIANQSFRAERTIDNQVTSCYTKLNIHSRAELALWVRDHGLLEDKDRDKDTNEDGKPKSDRKHRDDRKPRDEGKSK